MSKRDEARELAAEALQTASNMIGNPERPASTDINVQNAILMAIYHRLVALDDGKM